MRTAIMMLAAGAVLCAGAAKRSPGEFGATESRSGWTAGAGVSRAELEEMRDQANELWADYTNRMERARIRKERMDAARIRNGENVNGQPPVRPWRARPAKAMRVPASKKGGAK